ncbi:sigma-70 family RNA polymerase sigma factor [Sinanaerobacter chloroacetimidivorans]|jgi:RNA polymerase sigma-70 factor (ECF subfamily)|uniref:Sigma-70 family RNA polymerase sigma factor n=1 Tax=Sinanaerobacter chloroacetimidivorans TaxID=2818044 RepID=A0A8J7W281_9FIRM|nr:sigma-70 family RNA polymerase sigma factor [Sinanaerobacter chloroacetimidivorans]MBR0597798.1 sigma-70 family RNA polymerase sigma factor [Sinanaerobacter chloroacetimidivorans]
MKTINLRDYYPAYTSDTFLEVQDEIIEALTQFKRDDHAYYERRRVHKAYYSLDLDDGIENAVLFREPSPQEIYEKKIADQELYTAIRSLPERQARRIHACFFHGMSKAAIARAEGVCASTVCKSIACGLHRMEKALTNL